MPPREPTRLQRILRYVYNPFHAAQRVFRPSRSGVVVDPTVRKLQLWRTVAAVVASMFTFPLAMAPELEGFRDFVGIAGKVAIALLALWSLGFAIYGIGLSLVHVFRTADIHEMVPPILATFLVWEMAIIDVATGAYENVPPLARIAFMMGAPVTVTALSAWEVYRLRRHHGLRLRAALRG
ncbi:hypothetical protein [Streptomyces sp. NPDC000410]|uniref:hypothetical protein n=1 Tax=Streptomyces sp. NPDC000410 TaxID=3154254 RepID=UPI003324499F